MKTLDRFNKFVERIPESTCHYWSGSVDRSGYGYFKINGKTIKAHRASYLLHKDEIPQGFFVCHSCDNPTCVNPDHLWVGTARDNNMDMTKKGRQRHPGHGKDYYGPKNPNAKLSEEDLDFIVKNYKRGKAEELSKKFNVHKVTILRAVAAFRCKQEWTF